jgi:hypothetical protein
MPYFNKGSVHGHVCKELELHIESITATTGKAHNSNNYEGSTYNKVK